MEQLVGDMDERLQKLAKSSPNFGILYPLKPLLSLYGAQAEATVFTNPNSCRRRTRSVYCLPPSP
jgi:type I restriction enzyme R subunit